MTYILRNEAVKAVEQAGEQYSRNAGNQYARRSGRSAAKACADAIRSLPGVGWIPVSEGLPDACMTVLIYSPDNDDLTGYYDGSQWLTERGDYELSNVTHWMDVPPLPAKPEGGEG